MRITCNLRSQCPLFARAAKRALRSGTKYGKSLTITGNNEKSGCKPQILEISRKILDKSKLIRYRLRLSFDGCIRCTSRTVDGYVRGRFKLWQYDVGTRIKTAVYPSIRLRCAALRVRAVYRRSPGDITVVRWYVFVLFFSSFYSDRCDRLQLIKWINLYKQ